MALSRYVIGIDLGTSNCALSFIDTEAAEEHTRVLSIPQASEPGVTREAPVLPSFVYLPPEGAAVVGEAARDQSGRLPGRVVHSAKSWLVHSGVDQEEKLLPWGSEEVTPSARLSPVEVSAKYLEYLRRTWDETLGGKDAASRFERQDVTITVPASFDESAQLLTLKAARLAGFQEKVRLLEEPQAAFYFWLERHSREGSLTRALSEILPELKARAQTVLVCDIGGGTSDFSLFEIQPPAPRQRLPEIRRVAVSDHILLGGDNIDHALARHLETRLAQGGRKLSARIWTYLVFLSRGLKERVLSSTGDPEEEFHLSLPGEGAGLFASALTVGIRRREADALILEGFFPFCRSGEGPTRGQSGLREWGLPYATDSAVTRHLAGFLRERPVDAVLFTGGTLKPEFLQKRLLDQLTRWQGRAPAQLFNEEMDLAVARGAAYYGAVLQRPAGSRAAKIRGGYPHALFLELYRESPDVTPTLVCLLPKGFEAGDKLKIREQSFKLLLDQPVRFQLYYSNLRTGAAGDLVKLEGEDLHPLPPLQTQLTLKPGMQRPADGQLEVTVEATVSETGLLQVFCVHAGERWQLDFNLRKAAAAPGESQVPLDPGVPAGRIQAAIERIDLFYGKRRIADLKDSPKNLIRELEKILGAGRDDWNVGLLRSLWPALSPGITRRVRSPAHEITWLMLAGLCLRPGYGADLDPFRMSELWKSFKGGVAFPKNPLALTQWWILWRRVAGGLAAAEQSELLERVVPLLRPKAETLPEVILLAGSLERVDLERKKEVAHLLLKHLGNRKAQATERYLWSLGRLAARVPLYAGAQAAVPASQVAEWVDAVTAIDFGSRLPRNLALFYSQAARLTGDRNRDLSETMRESLLARLESLGATDEQKRAVREMVAADAQAQARIFGEALPAGLKLV